MWGWLGNNPFPPTSLHHVGPSGTMHVSGIEGVDVNRVEMASVCLFFYGKHIVTMSCHILFIKVCTICTVQWSVIRRQQSRKLTVTFSVLWVVESSEEMSVSGSTSTLTAPTRRREGDKKKEGAYVKQWSVLRLLVLELKIKEELPWL